MYRAVCRMKPWYLRLDMGRVHKQDEAMVLGVGHGSCAQTGGKPKHHDGIDKLEFQWPKGAALRERPPRTHATAHGLVKKYHLPSPEGQGARTNAGQFWYVLETSPEGSRYKPAQGCSRVVPGLLQVPSCILLSEISPIIGRSPSGPWTLRRPLGR